MNQMQLSRSTIIGSAILFLALASTRLAADTLVLKSGQTVTSRSFTRSGEWMVAASGGPIDGATAETRVPYGEVASVECTPPAILKNAPAMLAAGKASSVLAEVRLALPAHEGYGILTGSWWPDLFSLQAHVLLAMGRDAEVADLVTSMKKSGSPSLVGDAQALRALMASRKGDHSLAASLAEPLLKEGSRPRTLAAASVALGLGYLEKQKFPQALKAFLELPVFLPEETALSAMAQLGAAQAYFGMEDYDRAISTLEDLVKNQPGVAESTTAQSLLPEWTRRRRVVQEAKEP